MVIWNYFMRTKHITKDCRGNSRIALKKNEQPTTHKKINYPNPKHGNMGLSY